MPDKTPRIIIEWLCWLLLFVLILVTHLLWIIKSKNASVIARMGDAFIVLGICLTIRPFLRSGLKQSVNNALPGGSLPHYSSLEMIDARRKIQLQARSGILFDILAEKIVGVFIIMLGTLINGYGDIIVVYFGLGHY